MKNSPDAKDFLNAKLEEQAIAIDFSRALFKAGSSIAARIAMIAITIRSSVSENS